MTLSELRSALRASIVLQQSSSRSWEHLLSDLKARFANSIGRCWSIWSFVGSYGKTIVLQWQNGTNWQNSLFKSPRGGRHPRSSIKEIKYIEKMSWWLCIFDLRLEAQQRQKLTYYRPMNMPCSITETLTLESYLNDPASHASLESQVERSRTSLKDSGRVKQCLGPEPTPAHRVRFSVSIQNLSRYYDERKRRLYN